MWVGDTRASHKYFSLLVRGLVQIEPPQVEPLDPESNDLTIGPTRHDSVHNPMLYLLFQHLEVRLHSLGSLGGFGLADDVGPGGAVTAAHLTLRVALLLYHTQHPWVAVSSCKIKLDTK